MHLLLTTTFASHYSISITLCCAFAIVYTSMACYILNCTSMDSFSFFATTSSSLTSVCTICASTKCYSLALSSSDFSMHTLSTNVTLACLLSYTPTSSTFVQKFNCRCFSYIYILNYHLHKLYLLIICLPFCPFKK